MDKYYHYSYIGAVSPTRHTRYPALYARYTQPAAVSLLAGTSHGQNKPTPKQTHLMHPWWDDRAPRVCPIRSSVCLFLCLSASVYRFVCLSRDLDWRRGALEARVGERAGPVVRDVLDLERQG